MCFAKSKGFLCEGCGCLEHLLLTHLPWPRPQVTSCWFKSCLWEILGCGWWQRGHRPLPVGGGPCLLCPNWALSLPVSSRAGVGKGGVLTYWHSARPGFSLWLRIGDLAADLTLPSPDSRIVEAPTPN